MIKGFNKEMFSDYQTYLDMYMPEEFFEIAYRYSLVFPTHWMTSNDTFATFVTTAFTWGNTLEGGVFWQEIADEIYNPDFCNINTTELKNFIDFKPFN